MTSKSIRNIQRINIICLLLGFIILTSCKKREVLQPENIIDVPMNPEEPATDTVETPGRPTTPTPEPEKPSDQVVYDLGTGSGSLTIDGSTLKLATNSLIKIKGGTYTTLTIKNLTGTAAKPINIKNDGKVFITNVLNTQNITNVIIAGDNNPDIQYGFNFNNISYRAIVMAGKMNGVTLKSMSFVNVIDYTIYGDKSNGSSLAYTGTAASRTEGFKILNCLFENAGTIVFGGRLDRNTGEDTGLFKDVEIANNIFQNSPNVGQVCNFYNVQDFDIHHNVVNNINQNRTNHNGVFYMEGNGKFHHNKLTNYQGNSIRLNLYSRGSTPVTVEIYHNLCYNTSKYGGFELQMFDKQIYPGKSTYANAKVYNNTVGKMNTSGDWEGQVLDLYNTGGTLEYYNNLGFDLKTDKGAIGNMINNMSDVKITQYNNVYTTQDKAITTSSFASKVSAAGAAGF